MGKFSRFCSIAIAACLAAASSFAHAVERVPTFCIAAFRAVRDFVSAVPAKFTEPRLSFVERPVELVQACAYALGLAKRERPHVRSQWRMCPSV